MVNVVVYGLSTEGYAIASQIAERGAEVRLVDESTASAITLKPEMASMYPDVASLIEDEPLMKVEPTKVAVSQAKYLLFAPRIRRRWPDSRLEVNAKFKDATVHLQSGSSVICVMPMALGGNAEYISLLQHITGMTVGKQISHYYYPLHNGNQPDIIGAVSSKADPDLLRLLSTGSEKRFVTIPAAEQTHIINMLVKFSRITSIAEAYRHANDEATISDLSWETQNDIYLDTMADGLYDLHTIGQSSEDVNSMQHLIKGGIRGVKDYIKRLVDTILNTLRENGMKVRRTGVSIAWTIDRHGMRGDKIEALQNLRTRLEDYVGSVNIYGERQRFRGGKTALIVACTKADYEGVMESNRNTDTIVVKATPLMQTVKA